MDRIHLAQCALALGIARRALILTAKYATERHQFGRPIGTFQAVAQRAGDAYVDVESIRLTLFRAVWLLDHGRDAAHEIAVAKIVAAEAGHRVVCAAQHIHGGIGFDRDYPLYRYFLASKQNEFSFGAASAHTARLGRMIAGSERD
jgi:alkylation response protein AidB-like acyl-CoA dehydrogenase